MRLIQLLGDGVEELWNFPDDVTDEQIKQLYKDYTEADGEFLGGFEDYIDTLGEWAAVANRVYSEDVWIKN